MKTSQTIVIAIVSYVFFLLILTPASTIVAQLDLPPKRVSLDNVTGSIWSGNIDHAVINRQSVNNIQWSLSPWSLLVASINSDIEADVFNNRVNTNLDYSLLSSQIRLTDVKSTINASDIQKQLNLPFGELHGVIQVNAEQVDIIPKSLPAISALISWKKAQLTLAEKISFGDLFLRLSPADNGDLAGELSNIGGQLSIKGTIKVTAKQIYTLNVRLTPRANASAELLSIVKLVAPKKKANEHIINRSGHLRQLGIKL